MKTILYAVYLISIFVWMGCGTAEKQESSDNETNTLKTETTEQKITLTPVNTSPEYADAKLTMINPTSNGKVGAGEVSFAFNVEDYELSVQTADADIKQCANSGKGQHIHLILNNEPYLAFYEPSFTHELDAGNYVVLAFLSRSYHESIKNPNAAVLTQIQVGEGYYEKADLSAPHLFYSRPKGEYTGEDTKNILLDFYLANTTLSETGNKVIATINGTEFTISEWQPHFIKGLPMGEVTIKLELVDSSRSLIPGPFNSVQRKISLTE